MEPYISDYGFTHLKDLSNYIKLNLTHIYHATVDRNWNCDNRCDNTNRLYFIVDGEAVIKYNGKSIRLTPKKMYLIPANLQYSYQCDKFMEHIFIHFSLSIIPGKDLLSGTNEIFCFDISDDEFSNIKNIFYNENISSAMFLKTYIYNLLFSLVSLHNKRITNDFELYKKYFKLYDYINNNLYADVTVKQICKNAGYSQRHISYKFKADTDQTIKAYFTNQLLEKLKYMLVFSDMPIKEIAFALHFSDEFYCSRFFKKHMNISPREYRKKHLYKQNL